MPPAPRSGFGVDIGPDNDRKDILTPGWENWRFATAESARKSFGGIAVTVRRVGSVGSGLAANWWKGGIDYGATLTSDGVYVADGDRGGQLEMAISGLSAGKHTIVTYHNSIWNSPLSRFDVYVNGKLQLKGVSPTIKATHRDDAATACVEVEAVAGKDVVLSFAPDKSGQIDNIILNGFEIDRPDPARQALKPRRQMVTNMSRKNRNWPGEPRKRRSRMRCTSGPIRIVLRTPPRNRPNFKDGRRHRR